MANQDEGINRVGLGVDLFGGQDVLSNLRAIRLEMQAIASLAQQTRIPSNVGGAQSRFADPNQGRLFEESAKQYEASEQRKTRAQKDELNQRERDFLAHRNRMEAQRRKLEESRQPITDTEIEAGANKKLRNQELNERINHRAEQKEREHAAKMAKLAEERREMERRSLEAKQRFIAERRRLAEEEARTEDILSRDFSAERRQFRRYRRDPARDEQTDIYRDELAQSIRAQRLARRNLEQQRQERERLDFEHQQRQLSELRRRRQVEAERLSYDPNLYPVSREETRIFQSRSRQAQQDEETQRFRDEFAQRARATRIREQREREIQRQEEARRQSEARRQQEELERRAYMEDKARKNAERAERNRLAEIEQRISQTGPRRQTDIERQGYLFQNRAEQSAAAAAYRGGLTMYGPTRADFVDVEKTIEGINRVQDASQKLRQQLLGKPISLFSEKGRNEAQAIYTSLNQLGIRAEQLKTELNSVNMRRARTEVVNDLRAIEREQERLINQTRRLKEQEFALRSPRLQTAGPNLNDPRGLLNERGFFTSADVVGRITRNIILYEVVSQATYGLIDYIRNSVQAAKTTVEFSNALRFATESAGGNVQANNELVESLRPLGLSRQQARAAVTESARFTEERPQDIEALTRVVANIAAQRGQGIDRTDELIEQLRRRESKFYKRIFGKTVEEIYEDEAARKVDRNIATELSLFSSSGRVGGRTFQYGAPEDRDILSREKRIGQFVSGMTDAQKENAVLNFILSQQGRFYGEAEERARTLAGRLDKLSAAWLDSQEAVGLFITDIRLVSDLIENLTGKLGIIDTLRGPTLQRSGAGGTITRSDVELYGIQRSTGPRAEALNFINNQLPTLLLGGLGVGAFALAGRGQARQDYRSGVYSRQYQESLKIFEGDSNAAAQHAQMVAKEARPGLIRSAQSGAIRITQAINRIVIDTTNAVANVYGFQGIQPRVPTVPDFTGTRRYGGVGPSIPFGGAQRSIYTQEYLDLMDARNAERNRNVKSRGAFFDLSELSNQGNREYFEARNQQRLEQIERDRSRFGAGGGLVGGTLGVSLGLLVADKIQAGPITATALTVLGGAIGTAGGSAVGSAAGGAIGTAAVGAGGYTSLIAGSTILSGLLTTVLAALPAAIIAQIVTSPYLAEQRLRSIEAAQPAFETQAKERRQAYEDNRIRFRSTRAGDDYQLLTGRQVAQLVTDGRNRLTDFVEEVIPKSEHLRGLEKIFRDQRDALEELLTKAQTDNVAPIILERQLNALKAREDAQLTEGILGKDFVDDYRTRAAKREADRREQEQKQAVLDERKRQEAINQQANALSKLRDTVQGSFRLVGDVATSLTGPDNPYVKVFADGITVAERMRQQWGHLGDATVKYFTELEKRSIALQHVRLNFDSLAKSMDLINKAGRERDTREGPDYSTRENLGLGIAQAAIDSVQIRARANRREAQITGGYLGFNANFYSGIRGAIQEIQDIRTQGTIFGYAGGANQRQVRNLVTETTEQVLGQFSPQQIRNNPYLRQIALENVRNQRYEAQDRLGDAFKRLELQGREDERLRLDLQAAESRREELLRKGFSGRDVGQEFDRYILGRTEGISPKDLTYEQFEQRQAALRREAERTVQQEEEARQATKQGLEYQAQLLNEVKNLRAAIVGGNLQMLIQVQNDTQARIDQKALQDSNPDFKVALDQSEVKVNPYSPTLGRYGRGGRKR